LRIGEVLLFASRLFLLEGERFACGLRLKLGALILTLNLSIRSIA
jgi:hypothetical protein